MSRLRSFKSFLALVLAAGLFAACSDGDADQEATATPEPIPATALRLADVPGATTQTAYRGIQAEIFCYGIENNIRLSLRSEPGYAVTVEYQVADALVYETLALNMNTIRPNGSFAGTAKDIASCDGTYRSAQYCGRL